MTICCAGRLDWRKACTFFEDGLVQAAWEVWVGQARARRRAQHVQERRLARLADAHLRLVLMRGAWRSFCQWRLALLARARAVHSHCVRHRGRRAAFAAWRVSLEKRRREVTYSLMKHGRRSRAVVLTSCLRRWREYLQEQQVEREIESRVDSTWMRVQGWLT